MGYSARGNDWDRWDGRMGEWEQMDIFDMAFPLFQIDKPIRLIELFAGIGSQAMALRDLGAEFESWRISEWEIYANRSYKAIHNPDDNTDYSKKFEKFKWLARVLYEYGISADGKTKLALEDIRNRGEKWCRRIYNEFRANHNIGSIALADNRHGQVLLHCHLLVPVPGFERGWQAERDGKRQRHKVRPVMGSGTAARRVP